MLQVDNDVSVTDEPGCSPLMSSSEPPHRQTFQPLQNQVIHRIEAENLQHDCIPLAECAFWWDEVSGRRSSCMNSRFLRR